MNGQPEWMTRAGLARAERYAFEKAEAAANEPTGKAGTFGPGFSDAARRAADVVNTHVVANPGCSGRWVALRLSDGGSDGVLYDRKADAVRHQLHEQLCCYLKIPPGGVTPRQTENYLRFNRQLYDSGRRLQDPDQHTPMPMNPEQYGRGLIVPPARRVRRG